MAQDGLSNVCPGVWREISMMNGVVIVERWITHCIRTQQDTREIPFGLMFCKIVLEIGDDQLSCRTDSTAIMEKIRSPVQVFSVHIYRSCCKELRHCLHSVIRQSIGCNLVWFDPNIHEHCHTARWGYCSDQYGLLEFGLSVCLDNYVLITKISSCVTDPACPPLQIRAVQVLEFDAASSDNVFSSRLLQEAELRLHLIYLLLAVFGQ